MSQISVKVPTDYAMYDEKWIAGLTKRQILCFGAALLIGLPTYYSLKYFANKDVAKYALVLIVMPCFVFLKKVNGQPMELFLKAWLRRHFTPMTRPYVIENHYDFLTKEEDNDGKLQTKTTSASKAVKRRNEAKSKEFKIRTKNGATNPSV